MRYKLHTLLDQLDLTTNEKKVYLTSLEAGEMTVAELARRANIHRVAMYALVDNLVDKGFLVQHEKKGRHVSARNPSELKEVIAKKQRKLRKLELKYEELLPDLMHLYNRDGGKPRVQFFEGLKGLEQINQDIIDTLKVLPESERVTYSYSNPEAVDKRFEDYIFESEGYVDQRVRYGIVNKVITPDSSTVKKMLSKGGVKLCEALVLPPDKFPFKNDITIYHNKMAIESLEQELVGVIIESADMIHDQRAIFELAWAGALYLSEKK